MTSTASWDEVLATLDQYRALLLGLVADQLTYTIPLLAVPPAAPDLVGYHQRQMYEGVEYLHDTLQAARLNGALIVHEFEWAGRVLSRWGVTAEHFEQVIDHYVSTAQTLRTWGPAEHEALEELRGYLRRLTWSTFPEIEGPDSS